MKTHIKKTTNLNLSKIEFLSVKYLRNGIYNKDLQHVYDVAIGEKFLGDYLVKHKPKATYVFWYEGTILGFAIPRKNSETEWRVGAIYTLPEYRGLGVSKQFLLRFFKGVDVVASIEVDNISSIKLFTSCGFKPISSPEKHPDGTVMVEYKKVKTHA